MCNPTPKCQLLLSSSETESDFKNKMGIWDYISSTTDSIKRNAPDPTSVKGFRRNSYDSIKRNADYISSTTDSIKRNAPDPTSVKGFCRNSYDSIKRNAPDPTSVKGLYWSSYDSIKENAPDLTSVKGFCRSSYYNSRAAVIIIHDAFKVNAVDKLYPYLPDGETRSEIATNLAIVAAREGAKSIPGGSIVYNVVSQSHSRSSNKISKEHTEELKELKDKVKKLEKELSDSKKSVEELKDKVKKPEKELSDSKKSVEELKDKVKKPEKELGDSKKSVEHAQMPKPTTKLQSKI